MKKQALACAVIIAMCCLIPLRVQAQNFKLESGDLTFLKGETALGVQYVYEGMLVGEQKEADYVQQRAEEWNKKEPGKGDKWRLGWTQDRAGRYQPKFEKRLNETLAKLLPRKPITFQSSQKDAKYTMILRTSVTEPGWAGWGMFHKESHIDAVIKFVETAKPDAAVATINVKNSPGNGLDYDPAGRIEDAYATCGKELAHFLTKKALK